MKLVDARGLSCPEPLMLTRDALKEEDSVKVLVTEPHQARNIEKLAKTSAKKFTTSETEDGFEIVIE